MTQVRQIDLDIRQNGGVLRMKAVSEDGRRFVETYREVMPVKSESEGVMTFDGDYRDALIYELFDHSLAASLSF